MRPFHKLAMALLGLFLFNSAHSYQGLQQKDFDQINVLQVHGITGSRNGSTTVHITDQIEFQLQTPDSINLTAKDLYLYIDGMRLPTTRALSVENDRVMFVLYDTDTLQSMLSQSVKSWGVHTRNVRMSFGGQGGQHIHLEAPNITIDFDPNYIYRSWIGRIVIVLVIIGFFFLVKRDSFLKSTGSNKYSLSRTQMAWWTMIVICSYIALWSDSGILVELTSDTLILLGISSVTTALAQTIDKNKQDAATTVATTTVPPAANATLKSGKNFIDNILSDSEGISIQRFQSVVFTFFIGIFFVYKVIADFEMPDLDPGILGLMGLSSATYAGLKTNEKWGTGAASQETPEADPPPADPPPAE